MYNGHEFKPDIVIVGSNTDIVGLKSIILNNISTRLFLINSTTEAFDYIRKNNVDLLLLDLDFSESNPLDKVTTARRLAPELKIIALINGAFFKKAIECLNAGADDYIQKPFNKGVILTRVRNFLEQIRMSRELDSLTNRYSSLEKQYQYFIQNSNDIIYCLDEKGNFTFINDFAGKVLGYEPGNLIGSHYSSIVYSEYQDKAKYIFNERRSAKRNGSHIRLGLKPMQNGSPDKKGGRDYITVQLKAKGIYEENGKDKKYLGTFGIARDLSKYNDIEELFNLQHTYFQELFNNSPEAIVILDNNNTILDANKSFEKLFKYSNDELKFNNLHSLIVPGDLKQEAETFSFDLLSKGSIEEESTRVRKDGTRVNVSIYGYSIKFRDENVGKYLIYRDLSRRDGSSEELRESLAKLRKAMGGIVHAMVSTVEVRDPYTAGHQERVSNLARAIAQEMKLDRDEVDGIRMAGTLHDLGKVNIPAEILSRPGQLTDIEFSLIKRHPEIAYKILQNIETPWPVAEIVYQHHERLDGSGYPRGLKGEEISLAARILTVADVVEAIASHRPYRPALGIDKAICEIKKNTGILYDERVVDACIKILDEKRFVL